MRELITHTARAVGFLSRLPVPDRHFKGTGEPLSASAALFPIAGLIVAIPSALVVLLAGAIGLPAVVTAVLAAAVLTITTGALHEDGLADVFDGFFGGNDPQRRIDIMQDSAIGTYGTLALLLSLLLRIGLLTAILQATGVFATAVILCCTAAASRSLIVWSWSVLPSARHGGLADRSGVPADEAVRAALVLGGTIFAVAVLPTVGVLGFLVSSLFAWLVLAGFHRLCIGKIGGRTGDTLGATQQLTDLALLMGLVIAI